MKNKSAKKRILEHMRQEFVADLPTKITAIEQILLTLDLENYEELYRLVHSLKGSGGTHGLHIISTICHHLEDILGEMYQESFLDNHDCINACLSHIDLLNQACEAIQTSKNEFTHIEKKLFEIEIPHNERRFELLVADNTKLYTELIKDAVSELPVTISYVTNGFNALEQLLVKKYDALITGQEIPMLNGEALIAAIKLSKGINKSTFSILVSSQERKSRESHIAPDVIIKRNVELAETVKNKIATILKA